jgi:hypothetical protein
MRTAPKRTLHFFSPPGLGGWTARYISWRPTFDLFSFPRALFAGRPGSDHQDDSTAMGYEPLDSRLRLTVGVTRRLGAHDDNRVSRRPHRGALGPLCAATDQRYAGDSDDCSRMHMP